MKIKVAAAFIPDEAGRFLIGCRAQGKLKGLWEFPGGKEEPGETPEQTAVREVKEELNLDIVAEKLMGTFSHTYPDRGVTITIKLIKCRQIDPSQQIVSNGSHTEFRWVTSKETDGFAFPEVDAQIVEFLKLSKER